MRIKSLEIIGFKSFADKARLYFENGMTGVVGPNGCGKSNIVDAIRWCMGEMSAKHLRGRDMQDVIFAGSDSRGQLGMAEVTITFENDGDVPPAFANCSEISVTRRLFRDGSSKYLINKIEVRLRDITDLFLGTGVGTRAYSIIEQGRIGFVVNAKAEERRVLIEEVAGITKFKVRKKAAEKRMEATEQNLLRVNDVVNELDRQLVALRKQAHKATRYKALRQELRDLELHAAVLSYLENQASVKFATQQLTQTQQQLHDTQGELVGGEASLEARRLLLIEQERDVQRLQYESAQIDTSLAALERDLEHWQQQLVASQQQTEQSTYDLQDIAQREAFITQEEEKLKQADVDVDAMNQADAQALQQERTSLEHLQASCHEMDHLLECYQRDISEHMQHIAQQRAIAQARAQQREVSADKLVMLQKDLAVLQQEHVTAVSKRDTLVNSVLICNTKHAAIATDLRQLQDKLLACKQTLQEHTIKQDHINQMLHKKRSRLESLQTITQRLEGYSDGVRSLFDPKQDKPSIDGLLCLVTHIAAVPQAYELAIEAVLGQQLQYIVVTNPNVAVAALNFLKQQQKGCSGFIPLDITCTTTMPDVPSCIDGILGPAAKLVGIAQDVPATYQAILAYLLADILLVESLDVAYAVQAMPNNGWICVSLAGDVLYPAGVLVGGAQSSAGLLAVQREMRELDADVAALQETLAQHQYQQGILQAAYTALECDVQTTDAQLRQSELEKLHLSKDVDAAGVALQYIDKRMQHMQAEIEQYIEIEQRCARDMQEALEKVLASQQAVEDTQYQKDTLHDKRHDLAEQIKERTEVLTHLRVRVASFDEKARATRESLQRLIQSKKDIKTRQQRAQDTLAVCQDRIIELTAYMADGQTKAQRQSVVAQALRQQLSDVRGLYQTKQAEMLELERRLKTCRTEQDALSQSLLQTRMTLQRLALSQEHLIEHVQQRYDVTLCEVITTYHTRPMPDATTAARQQELERAIKAMGHINLTAIDECADVEKRYAFLVAQRDDLQQALGTLKHAIASINQKSTERFKEAFDAVNDMFQKVYPRLFRGGVARLELTHEDNLLESGIEIIAMPPGKKLQSVGLLSGGEKALTATALVFSIFLIKPSPFCILDEVDAPMDEANVGRFNDMLKEMSKISQFIVITHNKQTMLQVDRLYGVTMEEPGLSKIVAVDLQNITREQAA